MLPTVAEVLALDPVRSGAPRILAGAERLSTPVRWVHVIELAHAAHLLRGGELVLSTGIGLPSDAAGLGRYVAELVSVGVSALAVELGSRYSRNLPSALVAAAADHQLPLIVFERETQFIEITEAVHARIIDAQLAELRSADRLHQVFTELAVSGASSDEVVAQSGDAGRLPGHPGGPGAPGRSPARRSAQDAASLLAGFAGRSRSATLAGRTGYDAASGWLVTMVGARGEDWGRLIMIRGEAPRPGDRRSSSEPRQRWRSAACSTTSARVSSGRRTGRSCLPSSATATATRQRPRPGRVRSASRSPGACWYRLSSGWLAPRPRPGRPLRPGQRGSRTPWPRSAGSCRYPRWSARSTMTGSPRC